MALVPGELYEWLIWSPLWQMRMKRHLILGGDELR